MEAFLRSPFPEPFSNESLACFNSTLPYTNQHLIHEEETGNPQKSQRPLLGNRQLMLVLADLDHNPEPLLDLDKKDIEPIALVPVGQISSDESTNIKEYRPLDLSAEDSAYPPLGTWNGEKEQSPWFVPRIWTNSQISSMSKPANSIAL